jgi:GT2 family glycosyltransferase
MTPPQLAVMTVTHNSSQVIEGWIDVLEETARRSRMELCVVDSGSTPDERSFLRERVAPRSEVVCERVLDLGWATYGRALARMAGAARPGRGRPVSQHVADP